jgi:two-component system sensor histidine kinase DesK
MFSSVACNTRHGARSEQRRALPSRSAGSFMTEMATPPADSRYPQWAAASGFLYAFGVFIAPLAQRAGWPLWALTGASLVLFAFLYWDVLHRRAVRPARALANLALMAVLGMALMPLNVAAVTYVLYASALAPLVLVPRRAVQLFVLLAATVLLEVVLIDIPDRLVIGSWVTFLIFATGMTNLFLGERERQLARLRRAHEEIEGLATIAERERIARDLHDVLGHTLSVIALKSELASQLAETDPARAVAEIRDVEVVSREALSEVRAAVEGYRGRGFSGELQRARQALSASGVSLDMDIEPIRLLPKLETVLALVLREAVTNVMRHAQATACRVGLHHADRSLVLTVEDNGIGGVRPSGSGLAGMLERVRSAGGRLDIDSANGVAIRATFPWSGDAAS